jgi:hypothetical protein
MNRPLGGSRFNLELKLFSVNPDPPRPQLADVILKQFMGNALETHPIAAAAPPRKAMLEGIRRKSEGVCLTSKEGGALAANSLRTR